MIRTLKKRISRLETQTHKPRQSVFTWGMLREGVEAAVKRVSGLAHGGVLLVPEPMSKVEWDALAREQQAQLKGMR